MNRAPTLDSNASLTQLTEAIEKLTLQRESALQQETEERRQFMLREAQERIAREYAQSLREGVADLEESLNAERSQQVSQLRSLLFLARDGYARRVFEAVTAELTAFAASEDYAAFLCSLAESLGNENECSGGELRLRSEDLALQEKLARYFPADCTIKEDAQIVIGGLMLWLPRQHLLIDERLETRLETQKRWFYEESKMQIVW